MGTILEALQSKPRTIRYADLKVGEPFRWVEPRSAVGDKVCLKLAPAVKDIRILDASHMEFASVWTALEGDRVGEIFTSPDITAHVIPL
jgi:hypothetical protein